MLQMKPPNSHSHPHHAEPDARIIVYLVILVYTIQNASDFLQKKQKSYYFWKKNLPIINFKY